MFETPDFSLLGNPSRSDIEGMYKSLTSLQPDFNSFGRGGGVAYNRMMDNFRTGALNYYAQNGM